MRYHYDADGQYRGRSMSEGEAFAQGVGALAFFGLVGLVVYACLQWLWGTISNYSSLAPPYRWLVGSYYVTLVMPVKAANFAYAALLKATPWPNMNLVLGLVGWAVVWLLPYVCAFSILRRTLMGRRVLALCLVGPFMAILLWFVGSSTLGWLFAAPPPAEPSRGGLLTNASGRAERLGDFWGTEPKKTSKNTRQSPRPGPGGS